MHYFEFNIKDYRADAFQLTLIQHGAYKQLIDQYCLNESPLTLNLEDLFYDLLIRGDDEKKAIVFVLEKFFDKTENGYVHKRCDAVIKKYQAKSNQSRDAVNTRWAREKGKDTDVIRESYDRNTNQETETNKHETVYTSEKFLEFWDVWPKSKRKQSKPECFKKWKARKLDQIADKIIEHVKVCKESSQWKDGYEPAPLTYLNQGRYEDEVEVEHDWTIKRTV
jgi:uncharacterized protein YdaU (DUF1376 family)